MNYVVVLRGNQGSGKSHVLRELAGILYSKGENRKIFGKRQEIPDNKDILMTAEVNGVKIGVISAGDPKWVPNLEKSLNELKEEKCCVIYCACRICEFEEPAYVINKFCKNNCFKLIWTSTYRIDGVKSDEFIKNKHSLLNKQRAKELYELIEKGVFQDD
jgi:energy-coupling factor transporter ATP-binding protein EcfA2